MSESGIPAPAQQQRRHSHSHSRSRSSSSEQTPQPAATIAPQPTEIQPIKPQPTIKTTATATTTTTMAMTTAAVGILSLMSKVEAEKITGRRENETKLGERVHFATAPNQLLGTESEVAAALQTVPSEARFALLGIPEDIGPRANHGLRGTHEAWAPALHSILNVQSNAFLDGREILVLGNVFVSDLMARAESFTASTQQGLAGLRGLVSELDERVVAVVRAIVRSGRIPIVVGGGHNNCFPLIRGVAEGSGRGWINAVNLDAHTDFRIAEGRHSGNGFRYAFEGGWLQKYAAFGMQESYNNGPVVERLRKETNAGRVLAITYEDMQIRRTVPFAEAMAKCIEFLRYAPVGVEVDLDSVQDLLSSAATPCGFSPDKARRFVTGITESRLLTPAYLHIVEGIPRPERPSSVPSVPKFTGYLVTDFIKSVLRRPAGNATSTPSLKQ